MQCSNGAPSCGCRSTSPRVAVGSTGERETDGLVDEAHTFEPDDLPIELPALIAELGAKRAAEEQRRAHLEELARDTIRTLHLAA